MTFASWLRGLVGVSSLGRIGNPSYKKARSAVPRAAGTRFRPSVERLEDRVVPSAAVDFSAAQTFAVGPVPVSVAVGDFNGDSKPDLAVANNDGNSVSVLLGIGDGSFQTQQTFDVGSFPFSVAVGDFNGDGHLDLVVRRTSKS